MRILLGQLLRERMALGRAIKQYAKFQCREIMCCMVKLNDSKDMAKLPLEGVPEASSSVMRQDKAMDLEAEAGRWEGVNNTAQFNLQDKNFGSV